MLRFFYFDLGRVLLHFSVQRMCRQMGELAGVDPATVSSILFHGDLENRYERGEIQRAEFHEAFCRAAGTRADCAALIRAGSDIFEINVSMLPVVGQLHAAGYRLGILSNTCESHWEHCLARFRILAEDFQVYALSYRIRVLKPDAAIFREAARLAGVRPEEIFFTDDIEANVAGACAAGFDAVHYTDTPQLVAELRARGVRFNY
jgi:putative hydrolase of the HAD superfamily